MELKLNCEMTVEELKVFLKKLNGEKKNVEKGKKRSTSLYDILDAESSYLHYKSQHQHFVKKFQEEKERAWKFRNDEKEVEKAGWNYAGGKKGVLAENEKKQAAWLEKANTQINIDLWDVEVDIENTISILKSMS